MQQCIGARVRRLSRIVDGYYRKCLAGYDITENQMTILFVLNTMGKVEQGKIGEVLVLERSTVSRNVKLLEKQKLLSRTAAYRPEIALTEEGQDLVNTLIPHWEKVMDELYEKLESEGLLALYKMEEKLR